MFAYVAPASAAGSELNISQDLPPALAGEAVYFVRRGSARITPDNVQVQSSMTPNCRLSQSSSRTLHLT